MRGMKVLPLKEFGICLTLLNLISYSFSMTCKFSLSDKRDFYWMVITPNLARVERRGWGLTNELLLGGNNP